MLGRGWQGFQGESQNEYVAPARVAKRKLAQTDPEPGVAAEPKATKPKNVPKATKPKNVPKTTKSKNVPKTTKSENVPKNTKSKNVSSPKKDVNRKSAMVKTPAQHEFNPNPPVVI
jgi:hypothetical protein